MKHLECFLAGPTYHESSLCGAYASLLDNGVQDTDFVPGGENGVPLK